MANLLICGVRAWDDNATPPAAKALTTSPVAAPAGVMPAVPRANRLRLWVTIGGTAVSGIAFTLVPVERGTTTTAKHLQTNVQTAIAAGGAVTIEPALYQLDFAAPVTGQTVPIDVEIFPGVPYLVSVARVGGAADSTAIVTADFAEV